MEFQRGAATLHPETLNFADLGATVYCGPVADEFFEELPLLYHSVFTTKEWFAVFDRITPAGVCVLDDPRQVIVFAVKGDTLFVLNKASSFIEVTPLSPRDAWRMGSALFRALPRVRRIEVEVLFPPEELHVPLRLLSVEAQYMLNLPGTVEEYTASLGARTRKNLRNYRNRLKREHPDARTEALVPSPEEMKSLFAQFVGWADVRMRAKGKRSSFEQYPERCERTLAGLIACGATVHVTTIAGRPAAVEFACRAGLGVTIVAGCFDERYSDLNLGFLSTYRALCSSIEAGARHCDLMRRDAGGYKTRLGAQSVAVTRISLLRSEFARYWPPCEGCRVVCRQLRRRLGREERCRLFSRRATR